MLALITTTRPPAIRARLLKSSRAKNVPALGLTSSATYPVGKGFPRAHNLTNFMCRFSWNLGASNSWTPLGPVQACNGIALPLLYSFLLEAASTLEPQCGRKDCVNEKFGNRTRDLAACSTVPQPIAPPRAAWITEQYGEYIHMLLQFIL